jgi:gelsolin
MLKDKKINIADTNMALFGTDIERNIKRAAAQGEPAWQAAGRTVGIEIWRIEQFHVVPWPKKDYGKFHDGDSYIVLNTYKVEDALRWDVHIWLGENTTQDEAGTAAYKMVELDDFLGGAPVQHRDVQGHESELFESYFPKGVRYLPGGVDSGFTHVEEARFHPRLLHIKGDRKGKVFCHHVPLEAASLNSGDAFILDAGNTIWTFLGQRVSVEERMKVNQIANGLDDERGGKPEEHIIMEYEMHNNDQSTNKFWELLGGRVDRIKTQQEGGDDARAHVIQKMYKISDSSGALQTTEVPFAFSSLHGNDVFIVDVGSEIFVWVGLASSTMERKTAMQSGQTYLNKSGKPVWTPITRVMQGAENEALLSHFH